MLAVPFRAVTGDPFPVLLGGSKNRFAKQMQPAKGPPTRVAGPSLKTAGSRALVS